MFVYKTERSSNATIARVLSKINPDEYEIILLKFVQVYIYYMYTYIVVNF